MTKNKSTKQVVRNRVKPVKKSTGTKTKTRSFIQNNTPLLIVISTVVVLIALLASPSLFSSDNVPVTVKELANRYTTALVDCDYAEFIDTQGYSRETYDSLYGSNAQAAEDRFKETCSRFSNLEFLAIDVNTRQDGRTSSYDDTNYFVFYRISSSDENNNKIYQLNVADRLSDNKTVILPMISSVISQEEFDNR